MIKTKLYRFFSTHTKFCIIGGGTGGLNVSAHLLRAKVSSEDIRIF
jgi:cation diffusion facilitator CzcD-associated flavoprotein CzcO